LAIVTLDTRAAEGARRLAVGLCGAHRTGKTTLAQGLAERLGLPFARTSTAQVFQHHGLNPADVLDSATRLWIQGEILVAAQAVWAEYPHGFITDRTPMDFMAYTLADMHAAQAVNHEMVNDYLTACFAATHRYFSHLAVVQPGIALMPEPGKAALHPAYIEHLNTLIIGLCHDERAHPSTTLVLPRACLALTDRLAWLESKLARLRTTPEAA